jgi:hypothetical protein
MSPGTTLAAFILVGAAALAALTLTGRSPSASLTASAIEAASPCAQAALQRLVDDSPRRALMRSDLEAAEGRCASESAYRR